MSVKSSSSHGEPSGGPVVRSGYLRKLKTSKKKFFVLRAETCESMARLEYYDSEKKFNNGHASKRSIPLKTCFNINKRHDTKHKHVIALYTKDDCFCVVLDSEEDLDAWLKALLSQQQGEEVADGQTPRPTFEHIWQVTLLNRGLGATPLIAGYNKTSDTSIYRLCLTDKTLSLIRKDCDSPQAELSLSSIRSCGSLRNYFYLEAGRSSGIGAGELWMETEDANIAHNVHRTVFHAMTSNSSSREELGPKSRNRSSSATESSKPNIPRRPTLTGTPKPIPYQQDHTANVTETPAPCTSTNNTAGNVAWPGTVNHQRTRSLPLAHPAPITTDNPLHPPRAAKRSTNQSSKCCTDSRARCDSMPSRPRTTSEGHLFDRMAYFFQQHRPLPLHGRDISHSPPSGSPVSPPSAACSTDSAGSSLSIDETESWHDEPHRGRFPTSLTSDEAIAEENCDDCTDSPCIVHSSPLPTNSYVPMAPISSDDGYVDMSPGGRYTAMSPAASLSSVTSGTPSTDMRFAEYQLDKVASYFTPSEEDEISSAERPRTYSMGSKPYKSRMENNRDRAWSVGSKSKKGYNRVLPPHGPHNHPGGKSSSAPLLSNTRLHSSHSSIDPMDDLMEMDFSKKCNSGYMDMKPSKTPSGYVEMRPGHIEKPPDRTPYVDMRPGSSPAKSIYIPEITREAVNRSDCMEMDMRRNRIKPSSSPMSENSLTPFSRKISTSPQPEYIDMNMQARINEDAYVASPVKSTLSGYSHSPSPMDYMELVGYGKPASDTDGYMEMSVKQPSNDYTNMSLGSKMRERKKKSQPIMIQNSQNNQQKVSTSPIYTILTGRKNSTGTPPKMYLPLNCSSLPRQRSRKNSRRDSKDSSSSSVTTPSSSSTIFPFSLNSPCSPINPARSPDNKIKIAPRKDESDYVNYNPAPKRDTGDYAVIRPGRSASPLITQLAGMELADRCFKPISDEEAKPDKASRPSSENSEAGSTTSTIVGSRPASVNSDKIRVDGLHYASLDLAENEDVTKSPRTPKNAPVPAPAASCAAEPPAFTYAEIDFVRSEGLKSNQLLNTKIKQSGFSN